MNKLVFSFGEIFWRVLFLASTKKSLFSGSETRLRLTRLTLHVVNTGSIPVGPKHDEVRLLIHRGDVLKSGPKARRILRLGLNLEGMAEQSTNLDL